MGKNGEYEAGVGEDPDLKKPNPIDDCLGEDLHLADPQSLAEGEKRRRAGWSFHNTKPGRHTEGSK